MSLSDVIGAELELRRRRRKNSGLQAPDKWDDWSKTLFPDYFYSDFGKHHEDMWQWAESIKSGVKPKACISIIGRGGAKSTNAEGIVVRLGSTKRRRYAWYVSGTQDKADAHVGNIGFMLEKDSFSKYYYSMSSRAVGKYGSSKGWRRERLHTASGFIIDSLGLDTGARGVKIEDKRPDLIILDDVDELNDTIATVLKRINIITKTILPSGSKDCAVLFVQNLISPESVASRLLDGRADFLKNRIVIGPVPAVKNLAVNEETQDDGTTRYKIVGGEATWSGQSLETCQEQIDEWGYTAFRNESQHDVHARDNLWSTINFAHINFEDLPEFVDGAVWIDPAITSTDSSDCQGISAGGRTKLRKLIGVYWWEGIDSPRSAIKRGIYVALDYGFTRVGIETDQGGDTWIDVYANALKEVKEEVRARIISKHNGNDEEVNNEFQGIMWPKYTYAKAGHGHGSKMERNQRMHADYEKGKVIHMVGTHSAIENALWRIPNDPWDLADSMYWLWHDLLDGGTTKMHVAK